MTFFESLFGITVDHGNGSLELAWGVALMCAAWACWQSDRVATRLRRRGLR